MRDACLRCVQVKREPRPAVKEVIAFAKDGQRVTGLCREHLNEWHDWAGLIYGTTEFAGVLRE